MSCFSELYRILSKMVHLFRFLRVEKLQCKSGFIFISLRLLGFLIAKLLTLLRCIHTPTTAIPGPSVLSFLSRVSTCCLHFFLFFKHKLSCVFWSCLHINRLCLSNTRPYKYNKRSFCERGIIKVTPLRSVWIINTRYCFRSHIRKRNAG